MLTDWLLTRPEQGLTPAEQIRRQAILESKMRVQIREDLYRGPAKDKGGLLKKEVPLPYNKSFLVIHFGTYAQTVRRTMIPAEFSIAVFNVRDGIKQCYSRSIDPGNF